MIRIQMSSQDTWVRELSAAILMAATAFCGGCRSTEPGRAWHVAAASRAENISGNRWVISDLGAIADGTTLNTQAIQRAIDHAAASGGGTVVIPAGSFLTGAIFIKPGVNLSLEKGAVLRGSTNIADYPQTREWIEGHYQNYPAALLNADRVDHLQITGSGTVDGSGTPFYAEFRSRFAADKSTKNLDVLRPQMLYIANCSDVKLEGLQLLNSGFWNVHLFHSNHVIIDGLNIQAPPTSPSTDGIDLDCSQWVTIHDCRIANNDDGICIKGAKGPAAINDPENLPDEHIHVFNCAFGHSESFLTCGSEATIVRDVEVDHCRTFGNGPKHMLYLKLRTDTQQLYENIRFHDITLDGRGTIIEMSSWKQYENLAGQARPTHIVKDVSVSNITGKFGSLWNIRPNPGDEIQDLKLEAIDVTVSKSTPSVGMVQRLQLKDVKLNGLVYSNK